MANSKKIISGIVGVLLLAFAIFLYVKFFFVYSDGVNEGDINYFQREGFIFKTYEGKMIQTGYNSRNSQATIQSNEFKFSVADEEVAQQLMNQSSYRVKLHWKRYLGTLPWRGNSVYVVDSILQVKQPHAAEDVDELLMIPNE